VIVLLANFISSRLLLTFFSFPIFLMAFLVIEDKKFKEKRGYQSIHHEKSVTNTNKLKFLLQCFSLSLQDAELNANGCDKKNNHSSSAASSPTNELLLIDSTDNELIINTNGLDNGISGKLSADLSPNDLMLSSSRSTTPSDKENGMDSPPRACIMRALSIVS
jgi:hypothetical protein